MHEWYARWVRKCWPAGCKEVYICAKWQLPITHVPYYWNDTQMRRIFLFPFYLSTITLKRKWYDEIMVMCVIAFVCCRNEILPTQWMQIIGDNEANLSDSCAKRSRLFIEMQPEQLSERGKWMAVVVVLCRNFATHKRSKCQVASAKRWQTQIAWISH